jgi:RND family efflux transporter MFP subunit
VVLSFPFAGVVRALSVRPGDPVRRGQVLSKLDDAPARSRLAQATSARDKAVRDLERIDRLDTTVAPQAHDDATTALQIAEASLAAAEFEVRRSQLVAPADGVVIERFAEPDQTVSAGMRVLALATEGGFELEASLPAEDALRVATGATARVRLAAFPDHTFPAHVTERSGGADGIGTFHIALALDDTSTDLRSGLLGTFDLQSTGAIHRVVPLSALVEADGSDGVVYAADDGFARRVPVRITFVDGDRVAVSGADDVSHVVSVGTPFVRDGAPIAEVR